MEIDSVRVIECKGNDEVVEYLIEDKIEDEDWIEYVNSMMSYVGEECNWINKKEEWKDMFVIGDINKEVFEVDFCNELNSCLVIREDSEYFDRDFDLDLVEEVENKYNI
jgi:hypothetical protein